ncbi:PspC domain-containing protein [Nostocoides sp. F2B08]|uniref:ATP-binding protein n=1 Tax=Nostocoides sp. F2B08 TaxID=2653936 RepID=UPI001263C1CA|nr:ATP-binding protein [Tetrasphaera sp. F2B08]KAB7743609.1 PspC domain-containing protein [Tetrasphaera sp. F2B08]
MSTAPEHPRPPLVRPTDGRVLAGVCRGIATHLGADVKVVRIVFVILGVVSGAGIIAYLFLWALTPVEEAPSVIDPARPVQEQGGHPSPGAAAGGGGSATAAPGASSAIPRGAILLAIGTLTTLAGGIALLQSSGWNVRAGVLLPVLLIAIGAVLAWAQLDTTQRARWAGVDGWRGLGLARLGFGLGVVILGLLALATRGQSVNEIWDVALATLSILVGAALICAPFAVRLWADFRREQDARVRETERADIAAHLHDGVLQTLALIQRGADDPAYVTQLARKQERELRGWLYGSQEDPSQTLAAAATAAAVEVEELHGVPIEVVVTGDRPLDDGGRALVRALREALANAVRHGSPPVSAYVEIGPAAVEAFVRDHGCGFDPDTVPSDRLGVRESILGRMTRHGGTAEVRRRDPGTEVILCMPHTDTGGDAHQDAGAPDRAGDQRIPVETTVTGSQETAPTEPRPEPDLEVSIETREPDPVPRGGTPR